MNQEKRGCVLLLESIKAVPGCCTFGRGGRPIETTLYNSEGNLVVWRKGDLIEGTLSATWGGRYHKFVPDGADYYIYAGGNMGAPLWKEVSPLEMLASVAEEGK